MIIGKIEQLTTTSHYANEGDSQKVNKEEVMRALALYFNTTDAYSFEGARAAIDAALSKVRKG